MSTLIIAEKPSAARAIAAAIAPGYKEKQGYIIGGSYTITWAIGHLLSLADPDKYDPKYKRWSYSHLPIVPEKMKVLPAYKTKKQLDLIKELAGKAALIVNACDSAREGELIFGYIYQYLRLRQPVKRLWTSSLTPDAVREAFRNMKSGTAYAPLFRAAKARAEADWLIGMNGSRAFTIHHKELLSVGRVQTPVLAMLVDRQHAIETFIKETYYDIEATFIQGKQTYTGIWQGSRIMDKTQAETLSQKVKGKPGRITSYEVKHQNEYAYRLYDLTLLQKEANARYGFTAQKTLSLAQSLYEEKKAISYPRTNSNYVDESNIPVMHKVFDLLATTKYQELVRGANRSFVHSKNRNVCRPDKIEDHHAILPTEQIPKGLSADEEKIYDLIVRRFLSQFYPPAQFKLHSLLTEVEDEVFKSSIKEVLHLGWKVVYQQEKAKSKSDDSEAQESEEVPNFSIDPEKAVTCAETQVQEKETQPPKWYTEGTLVAAMQTAGKEIDDEELREAMKDSGIGTPATRAGIIERLKKVGYIQAQGKKLVVTPKGKMLIDIVRKSEIGVLTSAEMTGQWEKRLNEIAKGTASDQAFLETVIKFTVVIIAKVKSQEVVAKEAFGNEKKKEKIGSCPAPNCTGELIDGKKGYGCSRYKQGCTFVIWKNQYRKKISIKQVQQLITSGKTGFLKFRSKDNKPYEARIVLANKTTGETQLEFKNKIET